MASGSLDTEPGDTIGRPPPQPEVDSRVARLRRELTVSELEQLAARREVGRLSERLAEQEAVARELSKRFARSRVLEQRASALSLTLRQVRGDVDRALHSRAWRLGHSVTLALSRLARRPVRTEGALAAALARIDRALRATGGDSPPSGGERLSSERAAAHGERRLMPSVGGRTGAQRSPQEAQRARTARATLARQLRERLGPPPRRERWPSVSVIVPTRDGHEHLERLLEGLIEHTSYPELEVVVVDNGSTDGTAAYLRGLTAPFVVKVVAGGENLSFSEANARGVEQGVGELLLFVNNDVEPFEDGWLKELVGALQSDGVEAVGATLLHSEDHVSPTSGAIVQHRAIRFGWREGTIKAFNEGDGEGVWEEPFGAELRAPAVTAACLLISRDSFARVGGFDGSYRYGTEDVDLGLKLLRDGVESAGVGRSLLFHRESSSQNRAGRDFLRLNREENRRLFLECWGAHLRREYRLARLRCEPFWTGGGGAHVAITLTSLDPDDGWGDWHSGHEMGSALEDLGWRVSYVERKRDHWYELPGDLDYVLSLMDAFDLRRVPASVGKIAWIRNWTERWLDRPWFEAAELLLVSSRASAELIEARTGRQTVPFPLAVNPERFRPRPVEEAFAADYAFTGNWWGEDRDIQRALAPRGDERVAIYGRGWEQVAACAPYARGALPYEDLALLYPSVKLVLDDTQGPTLPYGALNARVFDALAAGTLVLTNCESGARELFDEDFPVWSSRESLRARLDELLGDEPRRRALAGRYREVVLARHTYAHRAEQLRELLIEQEQRLSFCFKVGAPDREVAHRWGDLHFAEAVARELRRRGHRALVQTLDEWEDEEGLTYDVAIHLKGLSHYLPKPGQLNVLWSVSHPAELTGEECEGYDLVAVASPLFADELRERTTKPVVVLEQAADPAVMYPDARPELAHELVYVANSRNVLRPIVRDLLPTGHDLAIWGANWEGLIDTSAVVAEHVPNSELRHIYSSAGIVLNDHWEDMRERGYISNRVYDALACGALVLSDEVPGMAERFGDAVAIYGSARELRELIERLLADPAERRRRAERGRAIVLAGHTFSQRVDELLSLVGARARESRLRRFAAAAA